jgi:HSP20 family molecular chaperone IbpA
MKKLSFLSRITGAHNSDHADDSFDDSFGPDEIRYDDSAVRHPKINARPSVDDWQKEEPEVEAGGELAVDIYESPKDNCIIVKAFIAGVPPSSLDIAITREMLTISGTRTDESEVEGDDFFQKELYWGMFSRTIMLPEEIDVDLAEASEKHGVLMIRLPKVDKRRQTKLKVKSR